MLVKGKNVIGLNIVTIDTGTVIESVDDIAFNPTTQRVEALLVSSGGLFSSAKAILMDDVHNIGEDAVVVPSASVIQSVKELGDSVHSIADSNKHLVKTNVLTIDGKELGRVTDMYFDSATGKVESMEVSQGGLKNLAEGKKSIKPFDIVTIGADATIVSAYTEMRLEQQGEEGGLKGFVNDAKDAVQDAAEKVKETGQSAAENVKDKSIQLRDAAQEKADDARNVIEQKTEQAKDRAQELRVDAERKGRELTETVNEKAEDLKVVANDKSEDVQLKANELANEAKRKSQEFRHSTEQKAEQAKQSVDELVEKTNERMNDVKNRSSDKIDTAHNKGRKVVEQTKKKIESQDMTMEVNKTKVIRKK